MLFKGIYHLAFAFFCHGSKRITIIEFLSGVLQGCPGSAFLFSSALDPLLWKIHSALRGKTAEFPPPVLMILGHFSQG